MSNLRAIVLLVLCLCSFALSVDHMQQQVDEIPQDNFG